MNGYKNKLEDRNDACELLPYDSSSTVQHDETIVSTIKNITKFYQGKGITQGHQRV